MKIDEIPRGVLPPEWNQLPRERQIDLLQFMLSRREMLAMLADVYGFDRPAADRDRLYNDELARIMVDSGTVDKWERQRLRQHEEASE